MEEPTATSTTASEDPLTRALDHLGQGSRFLWMIFLFTMFPTIFAGMHSNTYIFIAEVPSHWCAVPELSRATNWTGEQIRAVSSADPCTRYDFDYNYLAELEYEDAYKWSLENRGNASRVDCEEFSYAGDVEIRSMVEEWNLVCKREPHRAIVHMALSLGKLLGAGVLGVSADKYGRRSIYTLGILMFVIAAPLSAYVTWYWVFITLRLITGISFSAIQFSALTILTEVAGSTHRQWMGIAFNCGFASGSIFVAGMAYLASEWRQVQVGTSIPGLVLLFFMWYMPESPRWLISQGRREEAREILEGFHRGTIKEDPSGVFATSTKDGDQKTSALSDQIRGLKIIFGHCELRKRACITFFTWMSASFTYYALALNVDNFSVDYYLYAVLLGVTEIPAYLVPSPILSVMGRRQASSMFFSASGLLLLTILTISRSKTAAIIAASLIGRFSLSVAYGIIIMYTSEFFPTISRNSALGTSSAMAHVGSIVAPFSVDSLGKVGWWWPSTLCGTLALVAGFLCLALPETRNRPLADTVEEELAEGRGRVSLTRSCRLCAS